jgi:hypothetical protein
MRTAKKVLWVVVICLGGFSCSDHEYVPGGYIGIQDMSSILLDMQLADAYNDSYIPNRASLPQDRNLRVKEFYAQILTLHHTDQETFRKSYHFYEQHPDLMQKIYGLMTSSIDRKSAYADSVSERMERRLHPGEPRYWGKTKNFMFPYLHFLDSATSRRMRIFKPVDYTGEQKPPVRVRNFLLLYQSVADSVHDEPRRVFNPDLFY